MRYQDLMDDVLLEIATYLDYVSLIAWSQVSRHNHTLLSQSKPTLLTIAKNWDDYPPLSLPIHIPENVLTSEDLHRAFRRAIKLKRVWDKPRINSMLLEPSPLDIQDCVPGSTVLNILYFNGPGLVLLLLNNGDATRGGSLIVLCQISPPRKLALWNTGDGDVCSWNYHWVERGGRYKQLVLAASIRRPGWHDAATRNSLEVRTVDMDLFLSGKGAPILRSRAVCYWKEYYTSVVVSETTVGALVYHENTPIILTWMDWNTGRAENILIDAASFHFPPEVEDLTEELSFRDRRSGYAQAILLRDWLGMLQIATDGICGCIIAPSLADLPLPVPVYDCFPPFRHKKSLVIVKHSSISGDILSFRDGAAVTASVLHDPIELRALVAIPSGPDEETYNVKTIDFSPLYKEMQQPHMRPPGILSLANMTVRSQPLDGPYQPLIGSYAFSAIQIVLASNTDPGSNGFIAFDDEELRLHKLCSIESHPSKDTVLQLPEGLSPSLVEALALDDAAGVVCLKQEESEKLWFLQIY